MDSNWNYSGPAEAKVKAVDAYRRSKNIGDMTDEVKTTARNMCHDAIDVDEECFPAYATLGNIDWLDGDYERMMDHYLKAIDRCENPFDSEWFFDAIFTSLYEQLRTKPENWDSIAILWERIHTRRPEFKSLIPLCIACRHADDQRAADQALDDMQRANPEDSVKLARIALKKLKDPKKAASILETRINENLMTRRP